MNMNERFEWKTFDTLYALESFADYWAENEKLIKIAADEQEKKHAPTWTPTDDDERGEYDMEVRNIRHLHDEIMIPMFRQSCIVMLFSMVERELQRLVDNLNKEHGKQKLGPKDLRGSFLQQTNKFTEAFYSLSLTKCPEYNAVCDLQKIRDCIVHCRGEVSLVSESDRKYLLALKKTRPGFLALEHTELDIEAECIEQFIREVWRFFVWIFNELKWKLNDLWEQKKWAQFVDGIMAHAIRINT